jgi:hypothetical protein
VTRSDSVAEKTLASALLEAQRTVGAVPKGHTAKIKTDKGEYSYKYAAGEDMISAARDALLASGLTWTLVAYEIEGGNPPTLVATYMLEHPESEGQRLYTFPMPIASRNHADKALAGALTFGVSYALRGILNIPREDPNEPDKRTGEKDGVPFSKEPRQPAKRRPRAKPVPAGRTGAPEAIEDLARKVHEITGKGSTEGVIRWAETAFVDLHKRAPDYAKEDDRDAVSILLANEHAKRTEAW